MVIMISPFWFWANIGIRVYVRIGDDGVNLPWGLSGKIDITFRDLFDVLLFTIFHGRGFWVSVSAGKLSFPFYFWP